MRKAVSKETSYKSCTKNHGISMFYVYVLKCKDGSLYTGYTNDLEKRLKMHNEGKASKYTRSRCPVKLVKKFSFPTKSKAMKYEIAFKKLSRKEKLEKVRCAL